MLLLIGQSILLGVYKRSLLHLQFRVLEPNLVIVATYCKNLTDVLLALSTDGCGKFI
jgi:hypothetical protein